MLQVWQLLHKVPLLCLKISTPFTFCAFFKIDPPKLSLFENCTPLQRNIRSVPKYQQTRRIPFSDSFYKKLELPERFPQSVFCPVCAACVASLVAWTSADMFPRPQSSQIPACMRNQTSEVACFLALLVVCDLHPFSVSFRAWQFSIGKYCKYEHFESPRTENW